MREWTRRALELLAACSFAVAQPTFDTLGRNATFFVAQGAGLGGILALVGLLVVGLPFAILAIERLVAFLSNTAARIVHVIAVAGLVGVTVAPPLGRVFDATVAAWAAIAIASTVIAGAAYLRFNAFRRFLAWTAIGAVVFVAQFLFFSAVRELIVPARAAAAAESAESPTPVVFLLFDELQLGSLLTPEGVIDEQRYPAFARLQREATWYPNASTSRESTQWAAPSLLTGRRITEEKTPAAHNYPTNLFTIVDESQPVYAHEFVSRVCAPTVCDRVGSDPGFRSLLTDAAVVYGHVTLPRPLADRWLPPLIGRWAGFSAPVKPSAGKNGKTRAIDPEQHGFLGWVNRDIRSDQLDRYEAMLATMTRERAPALWYLHIGMPHVPWRFLPTMQTYETERKRLRGLTGEDWLDSPAAVNHGLQRYLLQLRFTDRLLDRLVNHLWEQGLYDESLLVVAADHGVSFRPGHNRRLIDDQNAADLVPVPLFLKYPGQRRGSIDRRNAELIDLLPTILDVLDIDAPTRLDGSSLRGPDPGRSTKYVFSGKSGPHVYRASIDGIGDTTRAIRSLVGPPGGEDDLFAFGPYRELVGTVVDEHDVGIPSPARVALEDTEAFDVVDPGGAFVPALVSGHFAGPVEAEDPLAVALNGKIAGVGWAFFHEGAMRIAVLVSPRYFREGKNDVEVYRIVDGSQLEPIPRTDP